MNLITRGVFFIILLATLGCTERPPSRQEKYSVLIDSLRQLVPSKMKEHYIGATAIALIDDTTVVWQQGFGSTDSSVSQVVNERTLFSVQSVSKIFTATAFMREMNDGNIQLDEKLKKYLPEFTVNSRFGVNDGDKITFRQLLSHRAGFGQEAPKGNNFSPIAYDFEYHVKSISKSWLKNPVGKFYSYSNPGFDLVGYALAKNARKSFETYMEDQLLIPLGMTGSTFDQAEAYKSGNIARGFIGPEQMKIRSINMLAAGGLYSNVIDLSKFVIFHLNGFRIGQKKLIADNLQREMYSIQFPEEKQFAGYGLGVRTRPFRGGHLVFHRGGGYGYSSMVIWSPEYKIGLVLLTNDGLGSPFISEISDQVLDELLIIKAGTLPEQEWMNFTDKPAQKVSAAHIKNLCGTYKSSRNSMELVEEHDTLYINGSQKTPLTAHSLFEFTAPNGEIFTFHFDEKQRVEYILNLNDANADAYMYNDSPDEPGGPGKKEWNKLIGVYAGANNDIPVTTTITLKNGYVYTTRRELQFHARNCKTQRVQARTFLFH